MSLKSLTIGTLAPSFGLTAILNAIGLNYENAFNQQLTTESYSVIILENADGISPHIRSALVKFAEDGGSVLEITKKPRFYKAHKVVSTQRSYLTNSNHHPGFDRVSHIDLFGKCGLSQNTDSYFEGLLDFQTSGKGTFSFIGLDITSIWSPKSPRRKRFHSEHGIPPDEIVSPVSRSEIIRLIETTLLELHIRANLPMVSKWHSLTKAPVFAFRIDSDYGTQQSLQDILDLARAKELSLTWFLHVNAHKEWLDYFETFGDQELALHCFEHGTSTSKEKILADLQKGNALLKAADIETKGFAAPYGIWSDGLKQSLSEFERSYSSEFTAGYEGVPYELELNEGHTLLQIPMHPICTGSLSRRKYTSATMKKYFDQVIETTLALQQPLILYHHPLQPGLDVVEHIFNRVTELGFKNLTFQEYADFWQTRSQFQFKAHYSNNKIHIDSNSSSQVLLKVSNSHLGFDLIDALGKTFELVPTSTFKYGEPSLPSPKEVRSLHSQKLRLLKTSIYDWKNRNRL
ncbi:MAG: hypothetical protein WC967_04285 [Balneolaceae bacterium]